jgi:hypothetical protein
MTEIKVTIILDGSDLVWIEQIVMDKDREEALKFIEKIKKKVDEQQKSHCKPPF